MTIDILNAYIQVCAPEEKKGERTIMKIRGLLVDWLCEIDPVLYLPFVVYEKGIKTLYLRVLKAIDGMLKVGLLWYRKL